MIPTHNLDGVYPGTGEIRFFLEAKMMGTPNDAAIPKPMGFGSLDAPTGEDGH